MSWAAMKCRCSTAFADLPADNLCGGIYQKAVPCVPFTRLAAAFTVANL